MRSARALSTAPGLPSQRTRPTYSYTITLVGETYSIPIRQIECNHCDWSDLVETSYSPIKELKANYHAHYKDVHENEQDD